MLINETENNLLIALAGDKRNDEIEALISRDIDWQYFVRLARTHYVTTLIYRNLRPWSDQVPNEVLHALEHRAKKSAFRNLRFAAELKDLGKVLEGNGIGFLSYKGPTLSKLAYGDSGFRNFVDLDLFIRKSDFPKIKSVILENGGDNAWNLTEKQEEAVIEYYYEHPFWFGKRPVMVEVHWAFMESFFGFDFEQEDLFGRSQTVSVQGTDFPTLSNEDLLIVLCVHGSKHYWKRLSWISDIAMLSRSQPIDWDIVLRRARKFGSLRMVSLGMFLANDMFQIEMPVEVQRQVEKDKKIAVLAEALKNEIFNGADSAESVRSRIHLMMRERWRDKFKYSQRLFRTKLIDSIFMPMGRPT
ncbi:MAG: nucleotidyltransferase family protein [Pyrinomonadaceae bacterium]|nr:nucleotidyltransferase family protein [Pyrinomonadaceae bacterium]